MGECVSTLRAKRSLLAHSLANLAAKSPAKSHLAPKPPEPIKRRFDPASASTSASRSDVPRLELNDATVGEYVQLEKAIHRLERRNVLKKFESKAIFADEVKKALDQLEATFKELKKQTEKERADVENIEQPSVKSFLVQHGTWQQRYEQALGRQEMAEKEMAAIRAQYDRAAKIAELYKQQSDTLSQLYEQQDRMLAGMFGPNYASERENKMEAELDDALEWQQRIALSKFKWTNGRVLLVHAITQMAFGIARWKELQLIETQNPRMRYFAAAEARNNFIAAAQNIQSCRVYLGRVKFPYATEEEMQVMEHTLQNAINDIQSNINLKKALNVYEVTHRKVASLIQWFDKVINDTILRDLDRANTNAARKQRHLREERLELMRRRVKEELGTDLDITYDHHHDVDETDEDLLAMEAESVKASCSEPANEKGEMASEAAAGAVVHPTNVEEAREPTPVSVGKLAPIPSKEALFGDAKKLIEELERSRKALQEKEQEAKTRLELAIEEKLRLRMQHRRRSRKQRRKSTILPLNNPMMAGIDEQSEERDSISGIGIGKRAITGTRYKK